MFVYRLLKFIFESSGLFLNREWIKYFFIFFEVFVIVYYFFLYKNLYLLCLFWIMFFLLFKFLNFFLFKFEKIVERIEKKEKIKAWLLKPEVCKSIYYIVWLLPWNIVYWTYFWIMENGWYFRVWFCSNRDIFFKKYFGWDSRDFFFNLNKILFENFLFKNFFLLKDNFLRFFLRILLLLSFFKNNLIKLFLIEYLMNILFLFCCLSFFFNFWVVNKFLFIVIFIIDIFFFRYLLNNSNNEIFSFFNKLFGPRILQLLMDPLTYEYYAPAKMFFEVNNMVWNEILGNSITLKILKEYMIWVNKNTKGYYLKKMNIMPKRNINKLFELNSIPFDILPRTRYVIMQLRYVNNNFYKLVVINNDNILKSLFIMPDYRIGKMKNMYLSYFEKTYAVDSSLLNIIFLLRMNVDLYYYLLAPFYENFIAQPFGRKSYHILSSQKSIFWQYRLIEISRANPKLLNVFYIFNLLSDEKRILDLENFFMYNFFLEDYKEKVPNIIFKTSLEDYKNNIFFLSSLFLYEEEGIVWSSNLQKSLDLFVKKVNLEKDETYKFFFKLYEYYNNPSIIIKFEHEEPFIIEDVLFKYFKLKFNQKFDLFFVLNLDLQDTKKLNLYLIKSDKEDDDSYSLLYDFFIVIENFDKYNKE